MVLSGTLGGMDDAQDKHDDAQVSETSAMRDPDQPIVPEDATAGYPSEDAESGAPQEGEAGPDAAPKENRAQPS